MKIKSYSGLIAALFIFVGTLRAAPLATAFTYQGRLLDHGEAANGLYDLRFTLYSASGVGSSVGSVQTDAGVGVSNGLFTVTLDFGGGTFDGTSYWLEIGVRTNGSLAAFTPLIPRQALTASPYALYAPNAGFASSVTANAVTGVSIQNGSITAAKLAAGQVVKSLNSLKDDVVLGVQAPLTLGTNGNTLQLSVSGGGASWSLSGNDGTTPGVDFLGTPDAKALEFKVNGARVLRLEPNASSPNILGGFNGNSIAAGKAGATIGGGGSGGAVNSANADYATVSGGLGNTADAPSVTISGGAQNTASQTYATVAGGYKNTNSGYATAIGGGYLNSADSFYTTISGGYQNFAGADYGVIGGGNQNILSSSTLAATIGGGFQNNIQGGAQQATIGGGNQNTIQAGAQQATVGGGSLNLIQNDAANATIGGGILNAIQMNAVNSTIGGGEKNRIDSNAYDATIGGGNGNWIQTNATGATIPGGDLNSVAGSYGFAAGRRAQANHQGAFVWGDSTDADIASTGSDQFVVRAAGGFYVYGAGGTQLLSLDPAGRLTTLGCIASASNSNLEFKVNGQPALRLEPTVNDISHSNTVNVVGGSSANFVASGVYGATIAGGGAANYFGASSNAILSDFGFVGGGYQNLIYDNAPASMIGGGCQNWIGSFASDSTIGGGDQNSIHPFSAYATIGGGFQNTIAWGGANSTIGGGFGNTTIGNYSTVPGGLNNVAQGDLSFAAGYRAKAEYRGAFVWGDSTDADIASTGNDQFVIRARGGVQLDGPSLTSLSFGSNVRQMINLWGTNYGIGVQAYTTYFRCDGSSPGQNGFAWFQGGSHSDSQNDPGPGGFELMSLDGSRLNVFGNVCANNVNCTSDRNAKENFEPLNCRRVLDKVLALPLTKWSYKKEPGSRHIGPMAQDFYAAFNVGLDDKHITTVDADGVALAAIQGLHEVVKEKEAKISALEKRLVEVEKLLKAVAQKQNEEGQ